MPTPIEEKRESLLKQGLDLGAPVQEEEAFADGGARQVFEFGVIYFHPDVGAFECHGLILVTYLAMGEQFSRLGYPITDESDHPFIPDGRINEFQAGELLFTPTDGVTVHFLVPTVIVKFADSIPIGLGQGEALSLNQLADVLGIAGEAAVAALADILPDLELRRVFDDLSPDEIADVVSRAQ